MLKESDKIKDLFRACKNNDIDTVKSLVSSKAVDLKQVHKNQKGYTLLHVACLYNNVKIAKILINNGADVNATNDGTAIVHSAVWHNLYKITALLIRSGAKINVTDKTGVQPLHLCAQLGEDKLDLFMLLYLTESDSVNEVHLKGMLSLYMGTAVNQQKLNTMLGKAVESLSGQRAIKLSKRELVTFAPSEYCDFSKLKTLNLSHNYIRHLPRHIMLMLNLVTLDLSHNKIEALPMKIPEALPNLQSFDVSYNLIDIVPSDLTDIPGLDLFGNPLCTIPAMFREDKNKLLFYAKYGGKREPWNQVKVMLVGHEGVGKTTFLKSLQGQNTAKNQNVSTNGVDITTVEIPCSFQNESLMSRITKKKEKIVCNVWDFGGQTVFHSTHRFFLTSSAIYVVVYSMADEQTHDRLQHWMHQIQSIVDTPGASMPILLVGTHADKLTTAEQEQVITKITRLYPVSNKTTGVQGHFAVSLSSKGDSGLHELKEAIVKIAKEHPKLGIGQVQVPSFLLLIKEKLEQLKDEKKYLSWSEYKNLCQEWTLILQELGVLVWNNTAQLKDIVITNPQWLADSLAGVVTMVNQGSIVRTGGVALRSKLYSIMRNKIAEVALYPIIFGLLERFEIILRMRNYYSGLTQLTTLLDKPQNEPPEEEDVKYFVPSLLLSHSLKKDIAHPAMQFWKRLNTKSGFSTLKRRFTWAFYPANFFPRLLLRLMHMQVSLLGSWVDAAVLMSQDQGHYSFIHLFSQDGSFILEVTVLQDNTRPVSYRDIMREALISDLAYAITRLDRDMWEDKPVKHEVIICLPSDQLRTSGDLLKASGDQLRSSSDRIENNSEQYKGPQMLELPIPFADCMNEVAKNTRCLNIANQIVEIDLITPDLSSCNGIHLLSLSGMSEIGRGGFGIVYKAVLNDISISTEKDVPVAIKEMKSDLDDEEVPSAEALRKIYEFQHEMLIMSKVKHRNLVQLYGVIKSPLSLVMEYVPCGDLHQLLKDSERADALGLKWRLKMAIDIARGMSHLHKQTPPICHSDLRAPNIFVVSLDEGAEVVGKVADFGLAQQIYPFSVQILGNLVETAPETWGDDGLTKGAMYDERSDVFSFAIILWRLFCANPRPSSSTASPPTILSSPISLPSPAISLSPPRSPVITSRPKREQGEITKEELKDSDPYGHLRDRKGQLNKWTLRNKIRQGDRPAIDAACPKDVGKLMEECWQFDATQRPFFPLIVQRLTALYASRFTDGEDDKYLAHSFSDVNAMPQPPQLDEKLINISGPTPLALKNWNPKPQIVSSEQSTWAIVSIIFVNGEIWAGTNTGAVLLVNPKTGKLEHIIPLQKSGRVSLLHAGRSCIWASCENEKICMINAQTRYKIVEVDNEHPVTCMAISYHHAGPTTPVVWVADTKGFVSLWDLTTVQKYCRFQVIGGPNPPVVKTMSVMFEHMWMAVGSDIVVIETQTLQKVVQSTGSSRINGIATVPSTRQAWTCSKDGSIKLWALQTKLNKQSKSREWSVAQLNTVKHEAEVKFVQPITATFPPLSRGHVITGDFNGKLTMWNSEAPPESFPMPAESSQHAMQCALDVGEFGLWVGTMNTANPLMRYHTNPFFQQTRASMSVKKPETFLGTRRASYV